MLSVPYISKDVSTIHPRMQYLVLYSVTILGSIIVVFVSVCFSTFLPPGPYDEQEQRVRYISDGFKDHRTAAFVCDAALILITMILFAFTSTASRRVMGLEEQTNLYYVTGVMVSAGLVTCMGFVLVSSFTEGAFHFLGAACFIVAHLVMQLACGWVLYKITTSCGKYIHSKNQEVFQKEKAESQKILDMQWVLGFIAVVLSSIFVSTMLQAVELERQAEGPSMTGPFYSASALTEYGVFCVFAVMNVLLALRIEYVAENYVPEEYMQHMPAYMCSIAWVAWVPASESTGGLREHKEFVHRFRGLL